MNNKPVVNASNRTILIGESIFASSIFTVSDLDGDAITKYRVSHTELGGYFTLDGIALSPNVVHEIAAADLSKLKYHAGNNIGNEEVKIWAYGGFEWSDAASAHMYSYRQNTLPLVLNLPHTLVLQNEMVRLADIVTAFDPDGRPIQTYAVRDRIAFGGTGALIYNNAVQPQNNMLILSAAEFENVYYAAGLPNYTEFLDIWAYDGVEWAYDWGWMGITPNNNRPIIESTSSIIPTFSLHDPNNFVSVYDEDGNTMKRYMVYDGGLAGTSGYFKLDSQILQANVWHTITAKQFDRLEFYGAGTAMVEQLQFRAYDGFYWSDARSIWFDTVPEPEITGDDIFIASEVENVSFGGFFAQTDPGPKLTKMQVYVLQDDPLGSHVRMAGTNLQAGQVHEMTIGQFNSLVLRTGVYEQRSYDQYQVRGFNGTFWTDWETIEVRTEPQFENALFFGSAFPSQNWGQFIEEQPLTVTYSFFQAYPTGVETNTATADNFSKLTDNQRAAVRRVFAQISSFSNLQFVEVADPVPNEYGGLGGIIRLGNYFDPDDTAAAFAYPPFDPATGEHTGDIWFNLAFLNPNNFFENTGEFMTAMHEIGHAIGLKHSFDPNATLPSDTENRNYSVMSYTGVGAFEPRTFQLYDVNALQRLYGINNSYRTGNDVYNLDNTLGGNSRAVATVWDAGGIDTFDMSDTNSSTSLDLRQGGVSSVGQGNNNLTVAFGTNIENGITGNGNDTLTGNFLNNILQGKGGKDTLNGEVGNDTLMGGAGSDTYVYKIGDGNDVINEEAMAGRDQIVLSSHQMLNAFFDDLSFSKIGRDLVINLTVDGGPSQGSIRIQDQQYGGYRIETLEFDGTRVDLVDLFGKLTGVDQKFTFTLNSSEFGQLVTPV
jgi:serralysin